MYNYIKKTFMAGLLILLPLILLFLAVKELIGLMVVVATPIADLFPEGTFDTEHQTEILAALIIICSALLIGMLAKIPANRTAGRYILERTVEKLPVYRMLHSLSSAFLKMEDSTSFRPALISSDTGMMEPAYIIEDHGRPLIVMLLPWSPTAFAGSVKLVPRERVHELSLTLNEFSLSLSNYGLGLTEILRQKEKKSKAATP